MSFLAEKVEQFRLAALHWPELANELRRMADECEEVIAEAREDHRRRGARA